MTCGLVKGGKTVILFFCSAATWMAQWLSISKLGDVVDGGGVVDEAGLAAILRNNWMLVKEMLLRPYQRWAEPSKLTRQLVVCRTVHTRPWSPMSSGSVESWSSH